MKKSISILLSICILTLCINTYLSYKRYNRYIQNLNINNTKDIFIDINDIYRYRVKLKELIKYTDKEWIKFWKRCEEYINYSYEKTYKETLYSILDNIKKNISSIEKLKIPTGEEYISNKVNEILEILNKIIHDLEIEINKDSEYKIKECFEEYKIIEKELLNLIKVLEQPISYEI